MIRNFFKHILESLKNLRRNGWMTVAAVSSVMITLILVGVFLTIILNTTKLANDIQGNVRVVAYTDLKIHDQAKTLPDPANANKTLPNPNYQKVYNSLKEVKNVKSIKFSSKDEQMTL
ncbi:MAG: cell division protein FtsX, partial [Streptococcaceae bacterium]|nr:cell division protein FtsX [Streptococcaceae bacterium]